MPDARRMLTEYQEQLRRVRGWGNPGLAEEARIGKIWLALVDVVCADERAARRAA